MGVAITTPGGRAALAVTSPRRRASESRLAPCPRPHCGGSMVDTGDGLRCVLCGRGEHLDYRDELYKDFVRR